MQCPKCKIEVKIDSSDEGTNNYSPVNEQLKEVVTKYKIPFHCDMCGALNFPLIAGKNIVFIWPKPVEEMMGSLYVPEMARGALKHDVGIVLAVYPTYFDKKSNQTYMTELRVGDAVIYDKSIPWQMDVKDAAGDKHKVEFMNILDVMAKVFEE